MGKAGSGWAEREVVKVEFWQTEEAKMLRVERGQVKMKMMT